MCYTHNMCNLNDKEKAVLVSLGNRLRALRLHRNEGQKTMSERLGVSRQKYARMEKGDPRIPISAWILASSILTRLSDWQSLLQEEDNLFLRAEIERKSKTRKRASKKR